MDAMDEEVATMRELYGRPVMGAAPKAPLVADMTRADARRVIVWSGRRPKPSIKGMVGYLKDSGFRCIDGRAYRFNGTSFDSVEKDAPLYALRCAVEEADAEGIVRVRDMKAAVEAWKEASDPQRTGCAGFDEMYSGRLIAFENCIYSIGRAKAVPPSPDVLPEVRIHAAYSPEAAAMADKAVGAVYRSITGSEKDMDLLLLGIGYAVYSTESPVIFVPEGPGGDAVSDALEALTGRRGIPGIWMGMRDLRRAEEASWELWHRLAPLPRTHAPREEEREVMLSQDGLAWLAFSSLKILIMHKWEGGGGVPATDASTRRRLTLSMPDSMAAWAHDALGAGSIDAMRRDLIGRDVDHTYMAYRAFVLDETETPLKRGEFREEVCRACGLRAVPGESSSRLVFALDPACRQEGGE